MSSAPKADYSELPFYLQHPGAVATIITIVIAGTFIYLVGSAYHPTDASHGAAPAASGSAAPAKH